ncbi:DMT family transporter [Halocynthiibacter namhaensis]|uniref:DMT family transporter n=1 Tax=Halocynthiibacter namhaensis TaxID=1290553 RepID=UPI00057900D6|nr:DMT family transporter [Halocynthiibacter namhaensis]
MDRSLFPAIALICAAMVLIPGGDAAGKILTATLSVSPFFVAWSRFLIGMLVFMPIVGRFDLHLYLDWRVWLRGAFITGGISSILTALRTEDIAVVFAIFFLGPILSYFASGFLLGERLERKRTALLLLGFCGVVLVVRPGPDMGVGAVYAAIAGVFYGSYLTASRWLADRARPLEMLLSQLVIGSLLLTPMGLISIPSFDHALTIPLLISALGSAIGNYCLVMAYRRAEASRLAPFIYLQLISATVFGALIFNTWPDILGFAGIALLLASGFATLLLRRTG